MRREWGVRLVSGVLAYAIIQFSAPSRATLQRLLNKGRNVRLDLVETAPLLRQPLSGGQEVPSDIRAVVGFLSGAGASTYSMSPAVKLHQSYQRLVEWAYPLRVTADASYRIAIRDEDVPGCRTLDVAFTSGEWTVARCHAQ